MSDVFTSEGAMNEKQRTAIEMQLSVFKDPTHESNVMAQQYVKHVELLLAEIDRLEATASGSLFREPIVVNAEALFTRSSSAKEAGSALATHLLKFAPQEWYRIEINMSRCRPSELISSLFESFLAQLEADPRRKDLREFARALQWRTAFPFQQDSIRRWLAADRCEFIAMGVRCERPAGHPPEHMAGTEDVIAAMTERLGLKVEVACAPIPTEPCAMTGAEFVRDAQKRLYPNGRQLNTDVTGPNRRYVGTGCQFCDESVAADYVVSPVPADVDSGFVTVDGKWYRIVNRRAHFDSCARTSYIGYIAALAPAEAPPGRIADNRKIETISMAELVGGEKKPS